jgi:hypothetical protein
MKSNIDFLNIFLILLVIIAFGTRYADYVWAKNTMLSIYAPCDTSTESCFIADKDSAWSDIQLEPYKKITIREKYASSCLEEHVCEKFSCSNTPDCIETLCSDSTLENGEKCTALVNPQATDTMSKQVTE